MANITEITTALEENLSQLGSLAEEKAKELIDVIDLLLNTFNLDKEAINKYKKVIKLVQELILG
jgi:hypothetical protein